MNMKITPIFPRIKPCSLSFGSTKRTKYLTEDDKVVVKPFYDKGCDFFGPKEETISQKHEGYSDGKYKDELLMNIDAYYYHRKKC
ncbi:hypothetical protein IKA15_00210 [bacterium]|nr:hypothetical protein [bacterium]